MKLFIDCEFNEFEGDLISMALVAEDGREWYEVLPCYQPKSWVAEHVMPLLGKAPITEELFKHGLQSFLAQFDTVHIVADWPDDIKYFCKMLILQAGQRMNTPPLTMEILRVDATSDVPHNALHDARGLRRYFT